MAIHPSRRASISPVAVLVFATVLMAALTLALLPLFPGRVRVQEGQVSSETVRSPKNVTFESQVATEIAREEAQKAVTVVEIYDGTIKREQVAKLDALIDRIGDTRAEGGLSDAAKADRIGKIPGIALSDAGRGAAVDFSDLEWQAVATEARTILSTILDNSFSDDEVEAQRQSVPSRIDPVLDQTQRQVVTELVTPLVAATRRIDEEQTRDEQRRAAESVPPQYKTISEGQVIMREGDIITRSTIEELEAVGLLKTRFRLGDLLAVVGVTSLSSLVLAVYLHRFQPRGLASVKRLALVVVVVVGMTVAARLYLTAVLPDTERHFLAFAFPVAVAPMVVGALLDVGLALVLAPVVAVLAAFAAVYLRGVAGVDVLDPLQPLQLVTAFFASGLAGLYVSHRAERMSRYLLAGVAVAVVAFLSMVSFTLLNEGWRPEDFLWMGGVAATAGLLSSLLTVGSFVVLGTLFDVTTRLHLMELAQLNQPLLRRLQEEAPGTFHHSIIVGNLAERAADLVGADPLLVRVGCYYHDIGKLSQPGFYIENQLSGENPHDQLDPHRSARIIAQHVTRGLDLAREYKLPTVVRAFIPEHHGTRRVTYFYRRAVEEAGKEVDPAPFTYPGPRPQSKETAIAMLADSSEAVVRASRDRSPEAIDAVVDQVIAERLAEGQFDDADLTMRDLRTIAESFKTTLRGVYHPRIEYPEPTEAERRALEAGRWLEGIEREDIEEPAAADAPGPAGLSRDGQDRYNGDRDQT